MENKEFHFPSIYRFKDAIKSTKTIVLDKDYEVFGKLLRAGSIIRVIGWREIKGENFLVVSKGSWESIIELKKLEHLIEQYT
jgi:hypothetical protein